MIEPSEDEVVIALHGNSICLAAGVGLEAIATVLERNATSATELLVVPFGDPSVGEKCVVAAGKAGFNATGDVVVCWVVLSGGVVGILPVACEWAREGQWALRS